MQGFEKSQPLTGSFVSQYPYPPSPYQTPGVPHGNWTPARPASTRKATIWLCVLAAVMLVFGGMACLGIWVVPDGMLQQQLNEMQKEVPQMSSMMIAPAGMSLVTWIRVSYSIVFGFLAVL